MEKMWENFRRFVENKEQTTFEDVEMLVKLARLYRAGNLQQAFATADAVGLLDGFMDILFFGVTNEIIDAIGDAEEAGDLDEEEGEEMFRTLGLRDEYRTGRKMREFLSSPASAQDPGLMNKILDMTDETFNSKGIPGLTSGGWAGTFEVKILIDMIRNPAQSENVLKRIVRLANKWKPEAAGATVRRYLWQIITKLDSEGPSGLRQHPNVTNAPEGPVARIGPGLRDPGSAHFSVGTKTINPEWVEWANS